MLGVCSSWAGSELSAPRTLNLLKPDVTPFQFQDAAAKFMEALGDAGDELSTRKMDATTLARLYRIVGDIPVSEIKPAHFNRHVG